MSIQSEIDRIAGAKTPLGNYLQQNGVAVPSGATLDEMALQLADVIEKQNKITAAGILKGDGAGGVSAATPGTDYLTEAPVTSVNGATGDVKSTFYVTVTQGDNYTATANKTAEEVYEAYAAGYAVYAIVNLSSLSVVTDTQSIDCLGDISDNSGRGCTFRQCAHKSLQIGNSSLILTDATSHLSCLRTMRSNPVN